MSKFSFSSPSRPGRASVAKPLHHGHQVSTAPEASEVALEFVFLPPDDTALGGGPWPRRHPRQWQNPNRQGTPLAFWRKVKDTLRYLAGGTYRGNYIAPGPHGRRNNIEPEELPGRGVDQPGSSRAGIASLPMRRTHLDVPPLPPFTLPDCIDPPPLATKLPRPQPIPIPFLGVKLTPDKPISYRQEIHFIGSSDKFIDRAEAKRVMSSLLTLMQNHRNVHVRILGNAATDFDASGFGLPYGHNKAALMKFPSGGIFRGVPYYDTPFRTMGSLMLARARAIGNLLISQGIEPSRVHCEVGTLGHGTLEVPNSGARKRRATIIISEKP